MSSELIKWVGEGCVCLDRTGFRVWGLTRVEGTLTLYSGVAGLRGP